MIFFNRDDFDFLLEGGRMQDLSPVERGEIYTAPNHLVAQTSVAREVVR